MSKIVVAKKVRLGKDGDAFKKDLVAQVERTNVKIDDEYIKEFNQDWKTTGRLFIIDKEATEKRNSTDKPDRDALKAKATELGLEFKANIKTDVLIKLIEDNK